jgi:pimeloyl-ACP methyl ester carboxylesterase
MFHGAQFSANTWLMLDMVEDLTKNGFRTILIDLPNHGGSDQTEAIVNEDEKGKNSIFKHTFQNI